MNGPDYIDLFPAIAIAKSWKRIETGSRPFKRKNCLSVNTQSNIPVKQAISTQQEQLETEEEIQQRRER